MTSLRGLIHKEWLHIRRDRRTAAVLVALPVVQVLLFVTLWKYEMASKNAQAQLRALRARLGAA